ncbi:hypothetical protein JOL79_20890 [Microbispora sp. RL4-1S]|uniref:Uncharacterized protein n=1 Tax=Microbispora oryzae TaxID=2806554 RepID=A0A941AJI5_9ACTN|nr:hypothetical protein [Microbispora oryzae]MBP2706271.1 hypothetical protein [Microbispora oryzae]
MITLIPHLMVETPVPEDGGHLTILILATMITMVLAAIRRLGRRAHIVVVVSGTSILLVVLAILVMAYLTALAII